MTPLLELKRIKKSFPGVKALDGIDLAIQRGEVHALLGENGAGKSTLVKIMCGIYQPDEGDIFIDGEQRRFNNYRQAIEAGVGIIFQEFSLIPYMSAIDNIFLNREIRNRWKYAGSAGDAAQGRGDLQAADGGYRSRLPGGAAERGAAAVR